MKYLCSLAMTTIAFASVSFPVLVLASSWPQSFQNNQRNAYVGEFSYGDLIVPDKNITPTLPYTNFKMPISADGINYFFEESRTQEIWIAYAIERASNTEIWRTSGSGLINSTPVLSGKTLIIPSKKLVALNIENGETLWQFSDDANYRFWYPLVEGDKVYAIRRYSSGGSNGYIYSLELSSGVMNWRTYLSAYGVTELSYYNESLIATTSDTTNYTTIGRYSVLNGSLLWSSVRFSSNFTSPTVIDSDNGLGLYSNAGGVVNAINLSDGSLSYAAGNGTTATVPVLRDNKAYFLTLNKNKTWLNSFDYVTKSALQKWEVAPNSVTTYRTQPLYLAGKIWFPTINGELWRFDVVSNELEKFPVGKNNDYLTNLLIADDQIVLANQDLNKIWSMSSEPTEIIAESKIVLVSPYSNSSDEHEYLGQLHSHYVPDIKIPGLEITPDYTVKKYKDAGYDFIALTEHNKVVPSPGVDGILFIENSEEDTQGHYGNHVLAIGTNTEVDETKTDQERLDDIYAQNGFASLAHPNSFYYQWKQGALNNISKANGLEIYNTGVDKGGRYLDVVTLKDFHWRDNAYASDRWDKLLSSRRQIWATAGDDFTPRNPGFDGAGVVVFARENTQSAIMASLKNGNFYALQGSSAPKIKVQVLGESISVSADTVSTIRFIGNNGALLQESKNKTDDSYKVAGDEVYVRVEVEDGEERRSWSQPIFVEKEEVQGIAANKSKTINFAKASLKAGADAEIDAETLSIAKYPKDSPASGYLSPVYSFKTTGKISSATSLSVDYTGINLPGREDQLSLYTFDESNNAWEKVESTVDKINKKVKAVLPHFSLYTLSSNVGPDTIDPTVSLGNPSILDPVSGLAALNILAVDDSKVETVSGYLDNNIFLFSDHSDADGFDTSIDFSKFPSGFHTLLLIATDAYGNQKEADYPVNIIGGITPPVLSLSVDQTLVCDVLNLSGQFTSSNALDSIGVFVNGIFDGEPTPLRGSFSYAIDLKEYLEGELGIGTIFVDKFGNKTKANLILQKRCGAINNSTEVNTEQDVDSRLEETRDKATSLVGGNVMAVQTEASQVNESAALATVPNPPALVDRIEEAGSSEVMAPSTKKNEGLMIDQPAIKGENIGNKKLIKKRYILYFLLLPAVIISILLGRRIVSNYRRGQRTTT